MEIAIIIFVATLLFVALALLWWANVTRKRDTRIIADLAEERDRLNDNIKKVSDNWFEEYKELNRQLDVELKCRLDLDEKMETLERDIRMLSKVSQDALTDLTKLYHRAQNAESYDGSYAYGYLLEMLESKYNFSLIAALSAVEAEREETDALLEELRNKLNGF